MTDTLPLEIVPIEDDGFHLIVGVRVNELNCRMLVDTGASKTVFDEEKLGRFMDARHFQLNGKLSTGLGTNSMESKLAMIENIRFNEIVLEGFEVAVLDLFHVNDSYRKLDIPPIDGVIGGDLLVTLNATIDYANRRILLRQ